MIKIITFLLMLSSAIFFTACGFHPQGEIKLVPPLHRIYLQAADPYGYLSRSLQSYLKMSHVQSVQTPAAAQTILVIMQDYTSQELLSISSTQQTRQYNLKATVLFQITDARGNVILPPQSLQESRVITVQVNQILAKSNEANLYYQQMRRSLAYAIMNRISSHEVSNTIVNYFSKDAKQL